jgi:hypothetical protein
MGKIFGSFYENQFFCFRILWVLLFCVKEIAREKIFQDSVVTAITQETINKTLKTLYQRATNEKSPSKSL